MANELRAYRGGDPFQAMQDQALRLMQQLASQGGQRRDTDQGNIIPAAEATEEDNAYRLTVEIPGIEPKDVDVSVIGNTLTLKAERRQHGETTGQQTQQGQGQQGQQRARHYLFREIQHGTVRREFGLPEDADRQRIEAQFRNGLLTLTIPKSQEANQRRRIEVRTTS
jgi:HSP20 family protein